MISRRFNCIFVHIPKCGGTSIENALWTPEERTEENLWKGERKGQYNIYQTGGLQHLKAHQIRHHLGRDAFAGFFKFTVVRNPYARMISQFTYMQKRNDLREFIGLDKRDDFSTYLQKIKRRSHVQWEPQISFVNGFDGKPLVDQVIKLENIEREWPVLLQNLKISDDIRLGHDNKSKQSASAADLTAEQKKTIREYFYEDFVAFGYEF